MRMAFVAALLAVTALAIACSDAPAARSPSDAPAATPAEAPVALPAAAGTAQSAELTPIALRVPDMSCGLCARPIEHHLRKMGVLDVKADLESKWITGRFDPHRITPEAIRARVEELRFRVAEVRVG